MSTIKQKIFTAKLAENIGKPRGKRKTVGQIAKEAGYSKSIQESPDKITKGLGFRDLLKKIIPEKEVVKLQKDLMYAAKLDQYKMSAELTDKQIKDLVESIPGCKVRKIQRPELMNEVIVYFWTPDNITRKGALDMFYKLDNKYPKDKEETDTNAAFKSYLDKLSKILP